MSFLDTALQAAAAASEIILKYYQQPLQVEHKSDQTPVTLADRQAEQCISAIIRKAYPEHTICGEEFGFDNTGSDYIWLIDPIDGTKSFVREYGFFSTQIALLHQEQLILGVSNAPAMQELAWAEHGSTAYLNQQALQVSQTNSIRQATISTGNINSLAGSPQWENLGRVLQRCNKTRGYGDFYHYHRLAAGQLDAVIESDVNILDIAALTVIVRSAGGVMTQLDGAPIDLNTSSILAANPALHAKLLQHLNA